MKECVKNNKDEDNHPKNKRKNENIRKTVKYCLENKQVVWKIYRIMNIIHLKTSENSEMLS